MQAMGIDIGGSGVKGGIVDLESGEIVSERLRLDTPSPSKPEAVASVVGQIVRSLHWAGPIGCTFPGVVYHGVIQTAANMDGSWLKVDAVTLFERVTGCPVRVLNDADAAGVAEMQHGAGRHQMGVVVLLTFGTGIGSAVFVNGHLLPNTEFGHLTIRGKDAELRAAGRVRKEQNLSWEQWAERVNEYLAALEFYLSPDLFIIGGGVSKRYDKFMHCLSTRARIVPAQLLNDAGIIGAAMHVSDLAMLNTTASVDDVPYAEPEPGDPEMLLAAMNTQLMELRADTPDYAATLA
jgi:polyphosphate glucokinase